MMDPRSGYKLFQENTSRHMGRHVLVVATILNTEFNNLASDYEPDGPGLAKSDEHHNHLARTLIFHPNIRSSVKTLAFTTRGLERKTQFGLVEMFRRAPVFPCLENLTISGCCSWTGLGVKLLPILPALRRLHVYHAHDVATFLDCVSLFAPQLWYLHISGFRHEASLALRVAELHQSVAPEVSLPTSRKYKGPMTLRFLVLEPASRATDDLDRTDWSTRMFADLQGLEQIQRRNPEAFQLRVVLPVQLRESMNTIKADWMDVVSGGDGCWQVASL